MNTAALDANDWRYYFRHWALVLGWFVLGLVTGHSYDTRGYVAEGEWEVRPREELVAK